MGQHPLKRTCRLGLSLLLAALVGCGGGDEDDATHPGRTGPPRALETTRPARSSRASIYSHEGDLLPSDVVVAGLPIPQGFEVSSERPRVTVLRGRVPVDKVLQYFGPRLMTGQVDPIGVGARYLDAVPVGVQGGVVHLDVSVLPRSSGGTRVEIFERLPPGAEPEPEPGAAPGAGGDGRPH